MCNFYQIFFGTITHLVHYSSHHLSTSGANQVASSVVGPLLDAMRVPAISARSPRAPEESGIMAVTDIREAQQRRDRIIQVADWVVANIPWTIAVSDWPGFPDRCSGLTALELADVETELHHRSEALSACDADLEAIAGTLTGRNDIWTEAANWLTAHPGASITDLEFRRLFGHLSRAELILAAIEHRQRLSRGVPT